MPQDLQLRPEMGASVLRHLRGMADLPAKGILAGQAVDSAITDLWLSGGGVYNDLDVFRQCPFQADRPERKASQTAMRSTLQLERRQTYGGMALIVETVETYGIASVSRQGLLNHVNCFMASGHFSEKLTAQRVLSGFDLNCVRVAVDLETGLLHWDRHYAEFQRSRQLKIAMMHTPWHTLVRLAKKREELPHVYADLDLAAQACTAVAQSDSIGQMLRDRDVSLMFGRKHMELAGQYSSLLRPYFEMQACHWVREKVPSQGKGWREARLGSADDDIALGKDRVELWKMRSLGSLDGDVQNRVNRLGKGALFFAHGMLEESRRRKTSQVYVKLDALRAYRQTQTPDPERDRVLQHLNLFETAYVEGQALPAVSDKVEAFFSKHGAFAGLMLGMSLAQQWETIQRIKKVVRQFANDRMAGDTEAPYGVLETQASAADLQDDVTLRRLLDEDLRRQSEPFKVVALKLPALPLRWRHYLVEELLTPLELQKEGRQMHHCVAGYAHAVRSGRSRILRIRNRQDSKAWSTCELRPLSRGKDEEPMVEVVQHRAKSNKKPDAINEAVVGYVVAMLNLSSEGREHLASGTFELWARSRQTANEVQAALYRRNHERLQTMARKMQEKLRDTERKLEESSKAWSAAQLYAELNAPADSLAPGLELPTAWQQPADFAEDIEF